MIQGGDRTVASDGTFAALDPKLTVFALANGMDLEKGPDHRRLEWFTAGLERAILIAPGPEGGFRLEVEAWPFGQKDGEAHRRATLSPSLALGDVLGSLAAAIDSANELR